MPPGLMRVCEFSKKCAPCRGDVDPGQRNSELDVRERARTDQGKGATGGGRLCKGNARGCRMEENWVDLVGEWVGWMGGREVWAASKSAGRPEPGVRSADLPEVVPCETKPTKPRHSPPPTRSRALHKRASAPVHLLTQPL